MPDARDSVSWNGDASAPAASSEPKAAAGGGGKPYLRLWFTCSGQYARAYRSADGSVYVGKCPKCGASARFPIGRGGTSERAFRVSC